MSDDLFQPTIGARPAITTPPWRPSSIVYPAFFGGPLAGTVLGLLNGRRLTLGWRPMVAIAAAGIAAIVGRAVVTVLLDGQGSVRIIGGLAGAAVWGVISLVQRRPFRVYEVAGGDAAKLVWPGLAAAIGCGLIENLVLFAVLA